MFRFLDIPLFILDPGIELLWNTLYPPVRLSEFFFFQNRSQDFSVLHEVRVSSNLKSDRPGFSKKVLAWRFSAKRAQNEFFLSYSNKSLKIDLIDCFWK